MKTYTVNAEKHEGWWMLTSPDAPGVVSQVRNLEDAGAHAREAIAFVLGLKESAVEVKVVPVAYAVTAKKWTGGWELHIEGVGVTQCRTLDSAERQVQDYIEITLGEVGAAVSLELAPEGPGTKTC